MSVDLNLIIPNQCRSLRDKEAATKYFYDAIDKISAYFHGHSEFISEVLIDIYEPAGGGNDVEIEYSFYLPIFGARAYMRCGYWEITTPYRYHTYFCHYAKDVIGNPRSWLRDLCFNILLAFGYTHGWVCSEYYGCLGDFEPTDATFDDWKSYGDTPEDSKIYEYNIGDFAGNGNDDCEAKYHDEYKELHLVFSEIKKMFPEYDVLSIYSPIDNYALAFRNNKFQLLNIKTGAPFVDFDFDSLNPDFNGCGIQLFKGTKSAFYNLEGKRLTDFRIGSFKLQWNDNSNDKNSFYILDEATGRKFYKDGTKCNEG